MNRVLCELATTISATFFAGEGEGDDFGPSATPPEPAERAADTFGTGGAALAQLQPTSLACDMTFRADLTVAINDMELLGAYPDQGRTTSCR